jgi:hypothetical protein
MSGSTWPPGSMRCGQRSLRRIVRPRAPELLVARHDLEGGSWRTASFLSAIHALTATRMARIGRGGQPAAGSHDPGCGGDRGRGSKTARIRLISPSSTWLQFTVGSGSVVEVCRSYQVSTSDPSTAISEMSIWIGAGRSPRLRQASKPAVRVPTQAEEAARDLVRAREDARADLMRVRHRLSKLLLRQGLLWPGAAWTQAHDTGCTSCTAGWLPARTWRRSAPRRGAAVVRAARDANRQHQIRSLVISDGLGPVRKGP